VRLAPLPADDPGRVIMKAACFGIALVCVTAATVPATAETRLAAVCYELYMPVCALKDGKPKQYSNECFAKLDGATQIQQGPCSSAK
jgi:hypothetical protein